jgi:hypothetical protein
LRFVAPASEHVFQTYYAPHQVNVLIGTLQKETGVDIKSFDNRYHISTRTGRKSITHKYSDSLFILLLKMRDGQPYEFQP